MSIQKRLIYMGLGGFLALSLFIGAFAAFAQTGDEDADEEITVPEVQSEEDATEEGETETAVPYRRFGFREFGRGFDHGNNTELLAEALGISAEDLEAAYETAAAAALQQAVDEGLLTEEQAEEFASRGRGFHKGFVFSHGDGTVDFDTLLADALGISVEDLQAARSEVYAAQLAELVEAGVLTQEEVDMILARQAVQEYFDSEAVSEAIQAEYEAAIEQALADGVITEAQAEQMLENAPAFGGFGIHGFQSGGRGGRQFRSGPGGGFFSPSFQGPVFSDAFGA